MKKKKESGGIYHFCSSEEICRYLKLSPKLRLEWLQEANRFIHKMQSSKVRKIWQKFRKGEI